MLCRYNTRQSTKHQKYPDREGYDEKMAEFANDLEKEPELLPGWIMIPGDC